MRLLLVEPNRYLITKVQSTFPFVFSLDAVSNFSEAKKLLLRKQYDAVLICRQKLFHLIHTQEKTVPIVFLPFTLTEQSLSLTEKNLRFGSLTLFIHQKEAYSDAYMLNLRKKEYQLLQNFLKYPQTTLKYSFLLQQMWDSWHKPQLTTLQRHVANLRQELKRCHATVRITTLHGVGYRLETL